MAPVKGFLDSPLPTAAPYGDGEILPLYLAIKSLMTTVSFCFYHGVYTTGLFSVPRPGVPTVLCFNHSNGLADPVLLIRTSPRMVRFCAKASLWKSKFGPYISGTGAVPLHRSSDNDGKKQDNSHMFRSVYEALDQGQCISMAPEGGSSMSTGLQLKPLFPGIGIIAVDAVLRQLAQGNDNFEINLVPVGLAYLNREKWRSDVLISYGPPLVVNKEYLEKRGVDQSMLDTKDPARRECVSSVVADLRVAMTNEMLTAPSWELLRSSITAGRLFTAMGAEFISLKDWIKITKHFAAALGADGEDTKELVRRLDEYQCALKEAGIRDTRVSRGPLSNQYLVACLVARCLLCSVLLTLSIPGSILHSPSFFLSNRYEIKTRDPSNSVNRDTAGELTNIRYNFDTLAENKMFVGFACTTSICMTTSFGTTVFCLLFSGAGFFRSIFNGGCAGLFAAILMWFTVRWWEDGIASARSVRSLWNLLHIKPAKLERLQEMRAALQPDVLALARKTQAPTPSDSNESSDGSWVKHSALFRALMWFSFHARRKKDWMEVMRLEEDLSFLDSGQANEN
jgi:glycerol-3-phosphate O-acyltransferase/dihydroxyacetone phosphate acyltransferase